MIPNYEKIMLPLLELIGDGKEHSFREVVNILPEKFNLTVEEKKETLPSGKTIFYNRTGWARTYLAKAGLLEYTRRGHFKITKRGLDVLKENPPRIDGKFLSRYPEFVEFQKVKKPKKEKEQPKIYEYKTPEDLMADGYIKLRESLASELLENIKKCSSDFFEKLVVELLVKMGYGGTRADAGKAVGKSGDGGIDGIIKEDKLGLDIVYVQAKKWENPVSRPEIQKFAGALQGKRARKGIFITTSTFSKGAEEYTSSIDSKIVLIDGEELAELMIDNNVGVSTEASYDIKKIDSDYFDED